MNMSVLVGAPTTAPDRNTGRVVVVSGLQTAKGEHYNGDKGVYKGREGGSC